MIVRCPSGVTVVCLPCLVILLCPSRALQTASRPLSTIGIMLNYSAIQLKEFNIYTTPSCKSVIKQLGLLRRPRYIHRSCRRKFVFSQSDRNISSLLSRVRTVASRTRHQGPATPRTSNAGVAMTILPTDQVGKRGVDLSLLRPIQRLTTTSNIKIELFNAQSITNKSGLIHDHILEKCLDMMCITETWHQPEVYSFLNETCPPGYCYLQKARSTGRGGGLAVIHRSDLILSSITLPELTSFECLAFKCQHPLSTTILLIYRPPKPNPSFIPEISNLLSTFCTMSANTIVLGDMNIHVNSSTCRFAAEFLQLLDCFNLTQLVDAPTHTRGHTLDLVITNSVYLSNLLVYDLGVSDHKAISMEMSSPSPFTKPKRQISFRNLKNINHETMTSDLQHLLSANCSQPTDLVDYYNNTLRSIMDLHAPVKTRTVTFARSAPWYTDELRKMKAAGRVIERRYKATGLSVHKLAFREHQKVYSKSLTKARSHFYSNVIKNSPGNSKQLFSTINHLLKPQTPSLIETTEEHCNDFLDFFKTKIDSIHSTFPGSSTLSTLNFPSQSAIPEPLHCFPEIRAPALLPRNHTARG